MSHRFDFSPYSHRQINQIKVIWDFIGRLNSKEKCALRKNAGKEYQVKSV